MIKFNHTGHKKIWDWLSKNPDKTKYDWEGWKHNGGQYEVSENFCFACEYDCETMTVMIIVTVARLFGRMM